jgi:putative transposase
MSKKKKWNGKNRCLNKLNTSIMLDLSHYRFRERLINKGKMFGCDIRVVSETYTTSTCSNCGNINDKVKGNHIYKCKNCGLLIDRDINASRNIYLRHS